MSYYDNIKTKQITGEELRSFTWEKFLYDSIDRYFNTRIDIHEGNEYEKTSIPVPTSKYWKQDKIRPYQSGKLIIPSKSSVAIYSKATYSVATFRAIIPNIESFWLGFESGANLGLGISSFWFIDGNIVRVASSGAFGWQWIDITNLVPNDIYTNIHTYSVYLLKDWSEFYIDNSLVAIGINSWKPHFGFISGPPYAIMRTYMPFPRELTSLVEGTNLSDNDAEVQIAPYNIRLGHIPEQPSRVFRLYKENSNEFFAGSTVDTSGITSHPIPIIGYNNKTLVFKANGNGTIHLDLLTQNNHWLEFFNAQTNANEATIIDITINAILIRVRFIPTHHHNNVTIDDAEIYLS